MAEGRPDLLTYGDNWTKTTEEITAGGSKTISLLPNGIVFWGDGTNEVNTKLLEVSKTHTYINAGTYTIVKYEVEVEEVEVESE